MPSELNRRPISIALTVAALVALVGCGGSDDTASTDDDPTTTDAGAVTESTDDPDSDTTEEDFYEAGQCYELDDDGVLTQTGCTEPHEFEVTGIITTPFEVVPPDVEDQLLVACATTLDEYMGDNTVGDGVKVANLFLDAEVGDTVTGTADELTVCLGQAPPGLSLTASVEGGIGNALDGYVPVAGLEAGECFLLYEEFAYVGTEAPCDTADALRYLGQVDIDGEDYPGLDEVKAQRDVDCVALAVGDGITDTDEVSGSVPAEGDWLVGNRWILCDIPASAS